MAAVASWLAWSVAFTANARTLGARATHATASFERAVRYGALASICADCHARLLDHEVECSAMREAPKR